MEWQKIRTSILDDLKERSLANPRIRINALDSIESMIKTYFPNYYHNPTELLKIGKVEFKDLISKYKKLNSAESSIVNNIYDIVGGCKIKKSANEFNKESLTYKKRKRKQSKPEIVDSANKMNNPQYGLPPLVNAETLIIVLGTFPAKESLEANFYYNNQIPRFWIQALSTISDFSNISNEKRESLLLQKKIGLWDIFECVERGFGNKDKAIKKGKYNNLTQLLDDHISIRYILYNGKNADKWACDEHKRYFKEKKLKVEIMQSTSGSNSHFNNGESWRQFFEYLAN